jgi:ACDE family multidrug resistance protein
MALIFAITATSIMGNSLLAPAVPDILDDLGVGDGSAGALVAAVSLPGIVMAPLIGVLADRLGRRAVLVPCLVMFAVCGLGVAAAQSFAVILVARFGQGIGAAGLINLAVVIIGDHWQGAERTRMIGWNSAVLTLGLAVFPLLSGVVTELTSWRVALLPYGLALVTAAVTWHVLDAGRPPEPRTLREQLGGVGEVLRRPQIVAVLVSGCLTFFLVFGVFLTALPLHLEREFDLEAGARGLFLAIPAVTSTVVAFNLERLVRRFGRRAALVGSASLFVASFALMGLTQAVGLVVLACAVYGFGEGALVPVLQDVAVTEAPDEHRGAVVAVWVGAARLGQTLGPLSAGLLLGATSTSVTLVAGACLAATLVAIMARAPVTGRRRDRAHVA